MTTSYIAGGTSSATNLPTSAGTQYSPLGGMLTLSANSETSGLASLASTGGTLSKLAVRVTADPGAGNSWQFIVRVNSSDTSITVTVDHDNWNTIVTDASNSTAVSANQNLCLKIVTTGTPAAACCGYSVQFDSTTTKETLLPWSSALGNDLSTTVDNYMSIVHVYGDPTATEGNVMLRVPCDGILKNLYVKQYGQPGAGTATYSVSVNGGGVNAGLQVAITGTNTSGSDTSGHIDVSAGDTLAIICHPTSSPTLIGFAWGGLCFVPTNNGDFLLGAISVDNTANNGATNYGSLTGWSEWTTSDGSYGIPFGGTFNGKALYVLLNGEPGAGKSWAFTPRKDGSTSLTALTATVSDAATTGNSAATVSFPTGSYYDILAVPTSSPTNRLTAITLLGNSISVQYTSEDSATLPSTNAELSHVLDAAELIAVGSPDSSYASVNNTLGYGIFQFEYDATGKSGVIILWQDGKSDTAPSSKTVYLQIYKVAAVAGWETLDSENGVGAGTTFTLTGYKSDLTDYKDGSNIIYCRVYQPT